MQLSLCVGQARPLAMSIKRERGTDREKERERLIRPAGKTEVYVSCVVSSSSSSS